MRLLCKKGIFVFFVAVLAIGMLTASCANGKETNPGALVPEGATLALEVNVAAILASGGLAAIIDSVSSDGDGAGEPGKWLPGKWLDEVHRETGIDVRKISQLVIFSDAFSDSFLSVVSDFPEGSAPQAPQAGVIIKAILDETATVAAVENLTSQTMGTSDYKGRRLYGFGTSDYTARRVYRSDDQGDAPAPAFSMAFLNGDIVVLGTTNAVQDVIDVQDGGRDRWSGPLVDAFNDVGSGLFRVGWDVPDISMLGLSPGPGDGPSVEGSLDNLPAGLGPWQDLDLLALSLAQNGQIMVLRMNLDFGTKESAMIAGEFLEGLLASELVGGLEATELLDRLEVSRDESRLTLRLEAPASLVGKFVSNLISGSETQVPASVGSGITDSKILETAP